MLCDRGHDGGGVRGVMKGKVFEKVGVNVSHVWGVLSEQGMAQIPGAKDSAGRFSATGISLVSHMANPHVPIVHMNLRCMETSKMWFGGGADLTPALPYDQDTQEFHAALRAACALAIVGFVLVLTTVILGATKAFAPSSSLPPDPACTNIMTPHPADFGTRRITFMRAGESRAVVVPESEPVGTAAAMAFGGGALRLRDSSGATLAPTLPCREVVGVVEVVGVE